MAFMCAVQGRRDFYFQDFKMELNRVWHTTNSQTSTTYGIAQPCGRDGKETNKRKG